MEMETHIKNTKFGIVKVKMKIVFFSQPQIVTLQILTVLCIFFRNGSSMIENGNSLRALCDVHRGAKTLLKN